MQRFETRALAVVAVHGLLLLALHSALRVDHRAGTSVLQVPLIVRLLREDAKPLPARAPAAPAARSNGAPGGTQPAPAPSSERPNLPQPALGAAVPESGPIHSADAPPTQAEAAQAAPAPALDLRLPRDAAAAWRWQNPAVEAQIGHRPAATLEDRIAEAAAQSGPWTEERIDADTVRLRRGNTCVLMRRPRATALDPMAPGARQAPWQAARPAPC